MTTFLIKAASIVEDEEGFLTPKGVEAATQYATTWIKEAARDLRLEREYPELAGLYYDIRSDASLAHRYAADLPTMEKADDLDAELQKAFGNTPDRLVLVE